MDIPLFTRHFTIASIVVVFLTPIFAGCDGAEDTPQCKVLGVDNRNNSAPLLDRQSLAAVAEFHLEQKITTYETGDCEVPTSSTDGVRLVIRNLTTCTLDIDFSLSVFEGRVGWTVLRTSVVEAGRAIDLGIISTANAPRVDNAQILLTGDFASSNCA